MKQCYPFLTQYFWIFKSCVLVNSPKLTIRLTRSRNNFVRLLQKTRGGTREITGTKALNKEIGMSIFKAIGQGLTGVGLEKPSYSCVNKEKDYEERHYEAAKWVSTTVQDISHESARSTGFSRLFNYITGENDKGVKIDMTAPVATRIVPGAGPNCESTFTVSFYIPPKHQTDPPSPTNKDVFIEQFPEMTLYASARGGFMNEEQWINEARGLSEKLKDKTFRQDYYFTAGYDSPFKLFNRTNEVWFVKE